MENKSESEINDMNGGGEEGEEDLRLAADCSSNK